VGWVWRLGSFLLIWRLDKSRVICPWVTVLGARVYWSAPDAVGLFSSKEGTQWTGGWCVGRDGRWCRHAPSLATTSSPSCPRIPHDALSPRSHPPPRPPSSTRHALTTLPPTHFHTTPHHTTPHHTTHTTPHHTTPNAPPLRHCCKRRLPSCRPPSAPPWSTRSSSCRPSYWASGACAHKDKKHRTCLVCMPHVECRVDTPGLTSLGLSPPPRSLCRGV